MTALEDELFSSFDAFLRDIVDPISLVADSKIFVQSTADIDGYRGSFERDFEYRELELFSLDAQSARVVGGPTKKLLSAVTNDELPNLRGWYVADRLRTRISDPTRVMVLQNAPAKIKLDTLSFDLFLLVTLH